MRDNINLQNNDLQNGYIYKQLVQRVDALENQIKGILKDIEQAKNDMAISVKDYNRIIKIVENNITRDEFEKHIDNKEIHCHRSHTLEGGCGCCNGGSNSGGSGNGNGVDGRFFTIVTRR